MESSSLPILALVAEMVEREEEKVETDGEEKVERAKDMVETEVTKVVTVLHHPIMIEKLIFH